MLDNFKLTDNNLGSKEVELEYEKPNSLLYHFQGNVKNFDGSTFAIDNNNIILRYSIT